jgi:hypothetical protein
MRFLLWPLLLYLQVGVHSQNRNPKKRKLPLKNKRNCYCFKKVHLECFFTALLAFLSRRKKGRKLLIMANCCSILQVSVHSQNRRGKKNTEKPKNKIKNFKKVHEI